jgi:hypothetical protein
MEVVLGFLILPSSPYSKEERDLSAVRRTHLFDGSGKLPNEEGGGFRLPSRCGIYCQKLLSLREARNEHSSSSVQFRLVGWPVSKTKNQ